MRGWEKGERGREGEGEREGERERKSEKMPVKLVLV